MTEVHPTSWTSFSPVSTLVYAPVSPSHFNLRCFGFPSVMKYPSRNINKQINKENYSVVFFIFDTFFFSKNHYFKNSKKL